MRYLNGKFGMWFAFLAMITENSLGFAEQIELKPVITATAAGPGIEYRQGEHTLITATEETPSGVRLLRPEQPPLPLIFPKFQQADQRITSDSIAVDGLNFTWSVTARTSSLIERTLTVTAEREQKFSLHFPLEIVPSGELASFTGKISEPQTVDTMVTGKWETFPVAMWRDDQRVVGIIGESPGLWDNRCQLQFDPAKNQIGIFTGDGRPAFEVVIKPPTDARDTYQCQFDGWQSLSKGETRRFTTWVFLSPQRSHYDCQLAAHLALANGQGWNQSAVDAILRNTSYFLLRRNLMKDAEFRPRDGKFIFISGPGYGWKQWVSDGFYTALGLDDPEKLIESNRAVFWTRMDYEENCQYYLIWAVLMQRAGGQPNRELVRRAYDFIRQHERDGLYCPPSLSGAPSAKGWKTYMDVLEYEPGDAPASNQGFHCGALMAAQELGLPVTDADIARAIAGYQSIFNTSRGFMPTSLMKQETLGQDVLYGATLTYAVFGKKILTDEQVLAHHRWSLQTASPYGLRVISQANGELLPGHNGSYVFGGSWFLCDAANYLLAGVHGLPEHEVNELLVKRIELEMAHVPAFHESISTVSGHPHGHILYSWNSGYRWLRQLVRQRLGQHGPDPVNTTVDAKHHVVRDQGFLRLELPAEKP